MQIQQLPSFSGKQVGASASQSDSISLDPAKKVGAIESDPLAQKDVFLQLLVAQIKYQNPLDPSDSMAYITQLSQFTSVEQLVGIRQDIGTLVDKQGSET